MVLFRGRVKKRELLENGHIRLHMAEMTRVHRTGQKDVWGDTGFDIQADVGDLPIPVRDPNEYVFLAKVQKMKRVLAEVGVIDVFTPGVLLGGLSQ